MKQQNSKNLIRIFEKNTGKKMKQKNKLLTQFLALIFCVQSSFATAQNNTIWIKSAYTPFQEFLVFIESSHSSSYASYLLSQKRERAKSFKLKNKLLKAQELYLSGESARSVQAFRDISNLAYQADWDKEERRIIMYSLLRMAQMEEEPEKRKALLLSASDFFTAETNKESYSDYNLFPPPLMKELKEIQKKKNDLSLDWNQVFPNHEIILLNGQRLEKNQILSLPQAVYKITALSSSHKAWSKNISLSELAGQTIKTASLTRGPCQKLELLTPNKNVKLAPVSSCPDLNVLSLKTKAENALTFNPADLEESETKTAQKTSSHWPSWLVLGAGVIALTLAILLGGSEDNSQTDDYVY
ncbi:MAG: hypothetical protein OXJ52_07550 [Oligoflexia bacterium]|nr:hypothetical protein [Oligoflexia bacterium]